MIYEKIAEINSKLSSCRDFVLNPDKRDSLRMDAETKLYEAKKLLSSLREYSKIQTLNEDEKLRLENIGFKLEAAERTMAALAKK